MFHAQKDSLLERFKQPVNTMSKSLSVNPIYQDGYTHPGKLFS